MKNIIIVLLTIVSLHSTWAIEHCSYSRSSHRKQKAEVTIHFKSESDWSLVDTYVWDARNFTDYQKIYPGKIVNNNFSFHIDIDHPVIIGFETDSLSLYSSRQAHSITRGFMMEPGDNLHLEVGGRLDLGIQNIVFTGKGSAKYRLIQELISKVNGKQRKWDYYLNVDELFARADSDKQEINTITARYKSRISPTAYKVLKLQYTMNAYSSAVSSLLEHINGMKDRRKYARYISMLKNEFTDSNARYDYNNFALMQILARLDVLLKTDKKYDAEYYSKNLYNQYKLLKTTYGQDRQITQPILAQLIINAILYKGKSHAVDTCIVDFIAYCNKSDEDYREMRQMLDSYKSKFEKGVTAYDFALRDTNGNVIRQSNFKGKVVVLDFFFTGCVGCITTTPYIDSLERIYSGKPIVFVSVSVDKLTETWKKGIGTYSSKNAIQLFTDGKATMHPVVKYYQVNSYPTIVLIDKAGSIVMARAPDPRTKEGWSNFRNKLDNILLGP